MIILLFLLPIRLYADEGVLFRDGFNSIIYDDDIVTVYEYDLERREYIEIISTYNLIYENKVPFLIISELNEDKWLFLHSLYFSVIYKNSEEPFFNGVGWSNDLNNIRNADIDATSFLKEGNINYYPENLGLNQPDTPWVEGVVGDGIGEKLILTWQAWKEANGSDGGIGCLIICNGYISYDKPYLYEKNNRIRRIRIKDNDGKYVIEVNLEDTPNPQLVFLPNVSKRMEIEILDVYKGTEWDDTCIHSIDGLEMNQALKLKNFIEKSVE